MSSYFGSFFMRKVGLGVVRDLRNELYAHIQKLSLKFFSGTHTGILTSRITNDVNEVQVAVTNAVESGVKDLLTLMALVGVAFWQDWRLASAAFFVFPLIIYPITRISKRMRKFTTKGQVKTADITSILMETFSGARIVKAFNMEEYETERFKSENYKLFRALLKRAQVRSLTGPLMEVVGSIGFAGVMLYGGWMTISDPNYFGVYISVIATLGLMYQHVKPLSRVNNNVQIALAAAVRIFDVLDTEPDIIDGPDAYDLAPIKKQIKLSRVTFSYEDEPVLRNINMTVKAGEVVAFVGMSGGGKTTLVNLIPRFYDVTEGEILIDGHDIRNVTLESLRSQIGMVTQQTILFSDTVKNNIAYGKQETSMDDIIAVAEAANAHKFIMELPEQYDTMIGEQGMRLSGGQRQRLSIARALLKNAPILILDEATSSLDTESEMEVQKALENLMQGRTTFVIAHRLSTIKYANRIMVVSNGRIVEKGTHDELLAKGGEYTKLYKMQFRDLEILTEGDAPPLLSD
jgi:subfamily B ATP-binding cassette protein MsbA